MNSNTSATRATGLSFYDLPDEIINHIGLNLEPITLKQIRLVSHRTLQFVKEMIEKRGICFKNFASKMGNNNIETKPKQYIQFALAMGLESLNFSNIVLRDADSLSLLTEKMPHLKKLSIPIKFMSEQQVAIFVKSFPSLKELQIRWAYKITNENIESLIENHKSLVSLALDDVRFDDKALKLSNQCVSLIKLRLSDSSIDSYALENIATAFPNLKELALFSTHVKGNEFKVICSLIPNLESITISRVTIKDEIFTSLNSLNSLKFLDLSNEGEHIEGDFFNKIVNLTSLETLCFHNMPFIKDSAILNLIQNLPSLKELRIDGARLHKSVSAAYPSLKLQGSTFH